MSQVGHLGGTSQTSSMRKIRVGLCEDDPFTRSTLEASLTLSELEVVFGAGSATETMALVESTRPHAVVIDLHLGEGPNGLDLARAIRSKNPEIGIVFLTSFESPGVLANSNVQLPSGSQYLVKRDIKSVDEIVHAIQSAIRKRPSSSKVIGGLSQQLTERQIEVLRLVSEGMTNQEIAAQLSIEPKTVEGVIRRIGKNLGIESRQNANQRVHMARAYLKATGALRD